MPPKTTEPWPPLGANELVSLPQILARVRCSRRHFLRLVDRGSAPSPVRLGALLRWPQQVIEDWIAKGCPAREPRSR